jgi:DNA-directed RNA polymerase specialized sigma24 family protein
VSDHPVDPFDPVLAALIRSKAAKLAKLARDPAIDRDDLVQQLLLVLLEHRRKYDPARGSPIGFGYKLVQNATASLLRALRAEKRVPGGAAGPAHEVADYREPDEDLRDLILDTRAATNGLSLDEQGVASLLSRLAVTEVARESDVSRATVYNRRRTIRQQFENAGLAIHLRKNDHTL